MILLPKLKEMCIRDRFLNGDAYVTSGHILGANAFAYCYNNPIMYADYNGCIPEWLFMLGIGAAAADGPLPFGDLLLAGICVVWAVSALSALQMCIRDRCRDRVHPGLYGEPGVRTYGCEYAGRTYAGIDQPLL